MKHNWEHPAEEKAFTTQIKVIAFDDQGLAWIGAHCGKVKVRVRHAH